MDMLKKHWDFLTTILILFVVYAYQIFTRFDYHDNFYRYSYGQIDCAVQPQTAHLFSLGRFGGLLWNCYFNQGLTLGIAFTFIVRLFSFLLLLYFLHLVWSELDNCSIHPFSRIVALFMIASIYGVQEAIFFITTSAVLPALIIASWAYIYLRKHEKSTFIPLLLLAIAFTFYQFAPAVFLAMHFAQYLSKKESLNLRYPYIFLGASVLYFIVTKLILTLFICSACSPGERAVEVSNPISWLNKLENHSYFATHFFGPFLSNWIFIGITLFILALSTTNRVIRIDNIIVFIFYYCLIVGPLVISPGENTFFRTYIPQQILIVILIVYIINACSIAIRRFFGALLILMSATSVVLTNVNVITPLKREVSQLINYDFSKYDCVRVATNKPQIQYSFFSNIVNYKTDEWGSLTSNNWQDVRWLLSAISQHKLQLSPFSNKALNITVLDEDNYKEKSLKCQKLLELDSIIFK